jgi:23S rRNA (pseudouridine1915-N3)-methyltransferase
MKTIRVIWVGKPKSTHFAAACQSYAEKIGRFHALEEVCLKDAPGSLPVDRRVAAETRAVAQAITPRDFTVCLDQAGRSMTSVRLAGRLEGWMENRTRTPCFIVGGAFGLEGEFVKSCRVRLALSDMTLPHELARVVLYEQIYRAAAINHNIAYHH